MKVLYSVINYYYFVNKVMLVYRCCSLFSMLYVFLTNLNELNLCSAQPALINITYNFPEALHGVKVIFACSTSFPT